MNVETKKQNSANATASGNIESKAIQEQLGKLSNKAAKTMKVDGFRKGKVPAHIIQARFGEQLLQDAEQDKIREFVDIALKDLKVESKDLMGNPMFLKFDKNDDGISLEVRFALRPSVDLSSLKKAIPEFKVEEAKAEEIEERITSIAKQFGELKEVDRDLKEGDIAVIDFEGFVDEEPFEGGKAEKYSLEIGSKSFIEGFEEQLVGMKKGEKKDIHVTFPESYGATHLAGKPARFAIVLHEIKEREPAAIDDEFAKNLLPSEKEANVSLLKERIKEQITEEKKAKLYNEEVKEKFVRNLVETFQFDLPENIIEQEMDVLFRNEVNRLEQKELESLQGDAEAVKNRRETHREEASKNVKLTLLIDAIAQDKKISVSQQEVWQAIYQEAMMMRQDPKAVLEYYQKNGILPAVQMAILENKVLTSLLEADTEGKKD